MNALLEPHLALVLFLPWFLILGTLFWIYPRRPRGIARRLYDVTALLLATLAFLAAVHWAHAHADPDFGRMWPQVLATAVGYGAFLAVMAVAFVLRRAALRAR